MDKLPSRFPPPRPTNPFPPPLRRPNATSGGGGGKILSSCALATCFLVLVTIALAITFFFLFRPRSPTIHVSAVQIPGFSFGNGTVSFTFAQYAVVRNPNRAAFSHYDSSLQLIYAGNQVGFIYIPAGEIDGGRAKNIGGKFAVDSFPIAATPPMEGIMEVRSRMRVKGRVRVLRFFTHHVEATAGCLVGVSAGDGSVIGLSC
ncbi:hypothetical protein KFK09_026088 [Dendrobium nobile]|uniref:Late embryogenesis abundant protein LEA-2 subgroup domain-containing protein n=1 Tax=Dendrobium nobile TaxID=94219 RepID=A0A8T3A5R1_DENNO|nr:hypothetical protein KFK09_026088 [Dendrobium nobile]